MNKLKINKSFTHLKETSKFYSVYFPGLTPAFLHFLSKTGTILFEINEKITIFVLQVQKLSQIKIVDFYRIKF